MSEKTATRTSVSVDEFQEAERLYECARVSKAPEEQTKLYRQAADLGHPQSQDIMWQRAEGGIGMPVDHDEATKWLALAADYFHSLKATLARRYFDGTYVEKDEVRGNQLLEQAVKKDVIEAFCEIGVSYLNGRGLPNDEAKAIEYFNQAIERAERNHQGYKAASAHFCLGICYEQGLGGLRQDDSNAFTCYTKSADLGNREGMRKMFSYAQLALTEPEKLPEAAVPVLYRRLLAPRAK